MTSRITFPILTLAVHAYLLLGTQTDDLRKRAETLGVSLGASLLPFSINKIEDVRYLEHITRLKVSHPQVVYIKGIDDATPEAQSAFLKNLEEPQKNLFYILTAKHSGKILPTILSRCLIIRVNSPKLKINNEGVEKFEKMDLVERLTFVADFKKRDDTIDFLEALMGIWHSKLLGKEGGYAALAHNLKVASRVMAAIKANGNILLQMTNFVISLR